MVQQNYIISAAPGCRFNPQPSMMYESMWHCHSYSVGWIWSLAWELHMPMAAKKRNKTKKEKQKKFQYDPLCHMPLTWENDPPEFHLLPSGHSEFGFLLFEYAKHTPIWGPCSCVFLCLESSPTRSLSSLLLQRFWYHPIQLYLPGPSLSIPFNLLYFLKYFYYNRRNYLLFCLL